MRVAVVGSIMADLVMRCRSYPARGETITTDSFSMVAGGKGANQAVACARMACETTLIGSVGIDPFAQIALESLEQFGVNTEHILHTSSSPTGIASVVIDDSSENTILVARGANNDLSLDHLASCAEVITKADALLVQLEIPLPVVEGAMLLAHRAGVPILLDPAPAQQIPDSFFAFADIITPNEQEAKALTGIDPVNQDAATGAAQILHGRGARQVIIKRGPRGCLVSTANRQEFLAGIVQQPIDTVGAGDCFAGALIARWLESRDLFDACRFANVAAAIKVQRSNPQSGIPSRDEVNAQLEASM